MHRPTLLLSIHYCIVLNSVLIMIIPPTVYTNIYFYLASVLYNSENLVRAKMNHSETTSYHSS